jgi:hypothetical protein
VREKDSIPIAVNSCGVREAYGNIEGYNVHAYSHMDSISYTIPA